MIVPVFHFIIIEEREKKMVVIRWMFSTPTPIIAIISAIIALLAYNHQRKLTRKQNASKIADRYATEILPRCRYIDKLLDLAGLKEHIYKFVGFKEFTEKELNELLLNAGCTEESFKNKLNSINLAMLNEAFACSGCNAYITRYHESFVTVAINNPALLGRAINRFIIDCLNELESIAILFHYNLADEKLVYQSLHQTLLKHIKNWYFFISDENRNDQDRFFVNLIWLHNIWKKRKNADEVVINKILTRRSAAKQL